jgi:hypothetical protein
MVIAERRLHDYVSAFLHGSERGLRVLSLPEINDARARLAKALDVGALVLGASIAHRFEPRVGRELHVELAGSALTLKLGVMRAREVRGKLRRGEQPWFP